ncbi:MAG: hypothetical protein JWN23_2282 [Rhodocyclales bacterium]|nr:hypothetical protein [Rhodocyclales bacterium]
MNRSGMLPAQRLPRDTRSRAAIALLLARSADRTAHANDRSLLQHLIGTARLLIAWNAPIDTVRAGLCHSIYGTNAFRRASIAADERPLLQRTIGRRAEALVWLFSRLQRPATIICSMNNGAALVRQSCGHTRHVDRSVLQQLFVLECANLLDQGISIPRAQQLHRTAARQTGIPAAMLHAMHDQRRRALLGRSYISMS